MSNIRQEHIYPKEIRKYEKELLDFIIESGKNKRKTEIESHILGYFLLHPSLSQKQIQDLSQIFRDKKISSGAISNFLNHYLSYVPNIIKKEKVENKFRYHVITENIANMFSISQEVGIRILLESINFLNDIISNLKAIIPHEKEINFRKVLLNRTRELRDYFVYHMSLMDKFMAGKTGKKFAPNQEEFNKLKSSNMIETQMKFNSLEHIEQEIINFILKSPLFVFEEIKYQPIIVYLIIRKKVTQLELRNLTGLSSGLISEGLNFLESNGYINIEKIKGIRQRKYVLPSIGYFNMLKFYNRFQNIAHQKNKLNNILKEMNGRKDELQDLNGYSMIKNRISEFLKSFSIVEKGIILFKEAMKDFIFTT